MQLITLEASARTPGKGPARATRRAGNVPCVLYGPNQESISFQVPELEIRPLIYTNEFHRVEVIVDGTKYECILKHVDFHPTSDRAHHADFQMLQAGTAITLNVPVSYTGISLGQRNGGRTQMFTHELMVTCLPANIPDRIEIDVTEVTIGEAIHVRDLDYENLVFDASLDMTLYSVQMARGAEEGEEEEGEEGEEGEEDGEELVEEDAK